MSSLIKTVLCKNFEKGECQFGEKCHFAHGKDELRKKMCNAFLKGQCKFGKKCKFYHDFKQKNNFTLNNEEFPVLSEDVPIVVEIKWGKKTNVEKTIEKPVIKKKWGDYEDDDDDDELKLQLKIQKLKKERNNNVVKIVKEYEKDGQVLEEVSYNHVKSIEKRHF